MRNIIFIFLILPLFRSARAESAIFNYDDFGPQVLAYEAIGYQWFQWNDIGDCDPNKIYDIKVVVYWDETVTSIKGKYPVDPKNKKDFRYLTFNSALKYLNSAISEYKDKKNLIETREKLIKLKR